jgi:hypothetical protein
MLARGIEPLFPRLQIECITNYARPTKINIKSPPGRATGLSPAANKILNLVLAQG